MSRSAFWVGYVISAVGGAVAGAAVNGKAYAVVLGAASAAAAFTIGVILSGRLR